MTEEEKKPRGRPRKYAGRRPTWTIRLEEAHGDRIKAIAEKEGRSISEVCEQQIINSFRAEYVITVLESTLDNALADLKDCRKELVDSRLAFTSANLLKERAEENLAKAEEKATKFFEQMDRAIMRNIELEDSRNSLIKRVDELIELLAIANGIRHKAAS